MKYLKNTSLIFVLLLLFPVYAYSHNPGVHIPGEAEVREHSSIKKSCPIKRVSQQTLAIWGTMDGKGLSCPNLPLMFIENGDLVNFSYLPIIYKGKLTEGTPFSPYLDHGYTIDWTKTLESMEAELLSLSIKYNWSHKKCAYKNEAKIKCVIFNDIVSFEEEKKKIIERITERSFILR